MCLLYKLARIVFLTILIDLVQHSIPISHQLIATMPKFAPTTTNMNDVFKQHPKPDVMKVSLTSSNPIPISERGTDKVGPNRDIPRQSP